jgi:Peptidase family M28
VKVGTVLFPEAAGPGDLDLALARAAAPGVSWVRFDDTVLYWTPDDSRWPAAERLTSSAGLPLEQHSAPDQVEDLYLVTQVGRVFQREHRDVPVLLDKGRYLVVAMHPEQARRVQPRQEVCYGLRPLPADTIVFRTVTPAARAPEAHVQDLVEQASKNRYERHLTHLATLPTRHSLRPGFLEAAAWSRGQLEHLGYATAQTDITVGPALQRSHNVVADRTGNGPNPRGLVLVTAHLDSINLAGGPLAPAPGADDNGSGAAGLLEIAHVLAEHQAAHDLRLVLFGGEEEGLFGSRQYVAALSPTERDRIRAVINMDMIATKNTANRSVLLEGAPLSEWLIDDLAAAAGTYTSLTVQVSLYPFNSDHVPFIDASIPAVLTIEGADGANEHIHTAGDTLTHIDYDLALQIVRMNVATTASALADATS